LGTLNILREQLLFATGYIQLVKSQTVPALSLFNFFRYWHNRIQGVYHAKQSQSHTCPAVLGRPRFSFPLLIAHLRRTPVQVSRCEAMLMKAGGFSAHLVNRK
jgi:hypothetical protein